MVGAGVINDLMLEDILSQSEALAEGLPSLRRQVRAAGLPEPRRVVLTGSGDSYIAPVALHSLFRDRIAVPVMPLPSLDASRYLGPSEGDLVVVVSVSGEVARTIEAARRSHAAGGFTVAITADGGSTLATSSDCALVIPRPIDRSIPHSRDYSVTLLALACLLESLAAASFPQLDGLPEIVDEVVRRSLETVAEVPTTAGRTWFLGAGPDRGTAMFGALKYWEAAGLEAWWDDLEEFGHGSQLMARPGDRAVLIAAGPGAQRSVEMASGLERMGMDVLLVGGSEMVDGDRAHLRTVEAPDPLWHPFVSCVPTQALALAEAEARGLDVSITLAGRAHGPTFDEVHKEWTKRSAVVLADGSG